MFQKNQIREDEKVEKQKEKEKAERLEMHQKQKRGERPEFKRKCKYCR